MDIGFLRQEYEKFLAVAPEELGDAYFLQTWDTDPGYPHAFAKVRKKDTVFVEIGNVHARAKTGVFVDLFPYDAYPEDPVQRKRQGRRVMRYRQTLLMKARFTPWLRHKHPVRRLGSFVKCLPYIFLAAVSDREGMKARYTPVMQMYNHLDTPCVYEQSGGALYGKWVVPRACFDDFVMLPFEDTEFACPAGWDRYLTAVYGDYMTIPPEKERETHQSVQCAL
jgi:lipopolysaccharide cholinephosphotransferase